jgi:hypothetical protein
MKNIRRSNKKYSVNYLPVNKCFQSNRTETLLHKINASILTNFHFKIPFPTLGARTGVLHAVDKYFGAVDICRAAWSGRTGP